MGCSGEAIERVPCVLLRAVSVRILLGITCSRVPGSSVGIVTELRSGWSGIESRWGTRFSARPDRPWGPPSLLYNGYRVFPVGKVRPGRAADHSPPSSAAVMEE